MLEKYTSFKKNHGQNTLLQLFLPRTPSKHNFLQNKEHAADLKSKATSYSQIRTIFTEQFNIYNYQNFNLVAQ